MAPSLLAIFQLVLNNGEILSLELTIDISLACGTLLYQALLPNRHIEDFQCRFPRNDLFVTQYPDGVDAGIGGWVGEIVFAIARNHNRRKPSKGYYQNLGYLHREESAQSVGYYNNGSMVQEVEDWGENGASNGRRSVILRDMLFPCVGLSKQRG